MDKAPTALQEAVAGDEKREALTHCLNWRN